MICFLALAEKKRESLHNVDRYRWMCGIHVRFRSSNGLMVKRATSWELFINYCVDRFSGTAQERPV
jgi:hypothetical protein